MTARVSVIIPTCNRAYFVAEAAKSALNQTFEDTEIIVIDDGSTDNTCEVLRNLGSPKIKYIYQENSGIPAKARNRGIREAQGEYVAFLDSDDLWLPRKLELQTKELNARPEVGLVCTRSRAFGNVEGLSRKSLLRRGQSQSDFVFEKLLLRNPIGASTVMVRRACLESVGLFDEDTALRTAEDLELWLRIAHKYRAVCLNKVLAGYRLHASNLSADGTVQIRAWFNAVEKIDRKLGLSEALKEQARLRFHFLLTKEYVLRGDTRNLAKLRSALRTGRMSARTRFLLSVCSLGGIGMGKAAIDMGQLLCKGIATLSVFSALPA